MVRNALRQGRVQLIAPISGRDSQAVFGNWPNTNLTNISNALRNIKGEGRQTSDLNQNLRPHQQVSLDYLLFPSEIKPELFKQNSEKPENT